MSDDDLFADRVAVITGAGSGIGAALCRELARRGAIIVAADLDEAAAAGTARGCTNAATPVPSVATHARCDVTQADEVEQLAAETCASHGHIDLWINNAGIAIGGPTDSLSLDDWRRVLDVNLLGVVHGVHAIYPRMVARRSGHIVNIASVSGLAPYPFVLPYVTTKHAVVGLSQGLRAEARAHGVRVSVACPGMVRTPIWERSEVRGELARGRKLLDRISGAIMSADDCAAEIVRGVGANRGVIPVTAEARTAWLLNRLSPALATRMSSGLAGIARRLSRL